MSGDPAHTSFNVPAKITGWHEETGAKVELLVGIPGTAVKAGQEFVATLRHDPKKLDSRQLSFLTYKKRGLRTGGVVLLRKMTVDDASHISAKELEVLVESPRYGLFYLSPNAAVSILPPPPNSRVSKTGYVALLEQAIRVTDLDKALEDVQTALDLARSFGQPGLILTGEEPDGSAGEFVVTREGRVTSESLCNSLRESSALDEKLVKHINKGDTPWFLVPFFQADIDPDRESKISAQRENFQYGDEDEPTWTVCNCLLRTPGADAGWLINDTTPIVDDILSPDMLLTILEELDI